MSEGILKQKITINCIQFLKYLSEFGEEAIEGENGVSNAKELSESIFTILADAKKEFYEALADTDPVEAEFLIPVIKKWFGENSVPKDC